MGAAKEDRPMEWTTEEMDRLYGLYERHVDRLRTDVVRANRSLGSSQPERTALGRVSRSEFEALLRQPTDDPEVARLWVRRILRGHEHEFPERHSGASDTPHRRTGT
jgi:hypothetical protein